jgi:hypothetical protein
MLFGLFCFILSNSESTSAPELIAHPGSPTKGFVSAEYQLHPFITSGEQCVMLFFVSRHLFYPLPRTLAVLCSLTLKQCLGRDFRSFPQTKKERKQQPMLKSENTQVRVRKESKNRRRSTNKEKTRKKQARLEGRLFGKESLEDRWHSKGPRRK